MRVVFMGTPEFAVPSLRALVAAHDVVSVHTMPDRPAGRGLKAAIPPVKSAALGLGLPVRQPATLKDPSLAEEFASLRPHALVVAAFGRLVPQTFLDVPLFGGINVHASLLPRWRGAAPIQRAILAGDDVTGVSIMRMVAELDAGPCAAREALPLGGETTAASLVAALADLGAHLLLDVLDALQDGTVVWTEQDHGAATYAPKVAADDLRIDPSLSVADAVRRVRASLPSCPSRTRVAGVPLTLLEVSPSGGAHEPGRVYPSKRELVLGCAEGGLRVVKCRPEGKAEMDGAAFARGRRLTGEETWGGP